MGKVGVRQRPIRPMPKRKALQLSQKKICEDSYTEEPVSDGSHLHGNHSGNVTIPTKAGLLNAFDGPTANIGNMLFMTTNNYDA